MAAGEQLLQSSYFRGEFLVGIIIRDSMFLIKGTEDRKWKKDFESSTSNQKTKIHQIKSIAYR